MSTPADWPSEVLNEKPAEPGVDVTRALLGRKWLMILFVGVGLGLGHLYFTRQVPMYASSARILVQRSARHLPVDVIDKEKREDPLDNHIYLITQPVILNRAVEEGGLKELKTLSHVANPAQTVSNGLRVVRSGLSKDIIELTYIGTDRHDCKKILEAVTKAYRDWLAETQDSYGKEAERLITDARNKLEADLKDFEQKNQEFRNRAKLLFLDGKGANPHERELEKIANRQSDLTFSRQQLEAKLEHIKSAEQRGVSRESLLVLANMTSSGGAEVTSSEGGAPKIEANPYMSKVTELVMEKEKVLTEVGPNHPSVKRLEQRILALRDLLYQEAGSATGTAPKKDLLEVQIESLKERIKQYDRELALLDQMFQATQQSAKELAKEQHEQATLATEGTQRQKLFDTIVEQLSKVSLAKDQGILFASVTQPPGSGAQIGPDFPKYLGVGGAAGFLVAIALSFLLELADKSFRTPDEITRQLGLPVIGHIPELDAGRDWKVVKDTVVDRSLATHHRPKSRLAEAYRAVRAALYFGTRGQAHRVLQVTSADPGDGKSTLAANLAAAIATSGKKCLLIDADLRRPRVHNLFGVDNSVGVSSVIRDGMDIPDVVQQTAINNLSVMTVGPRVDNPAELLLSPRFTELVELVRQQYEFVIIDTPPVLAVTDPAAVAAHVDGVVLVVRITKRSRPHAKRACETLDLIGARVLGVVVNGVGEGTSGYGGGYGSGYGNPYRYGGGAGTRESGYADSYFSEATHER